MAFRVKFKVVKFIVTHKITYRFFMQFEWFKKVVIEIAREILKRQAVEADKRHENN